jgi:tetratricopeptide (TPR) repeat protein
MATDQAEHDDIAGAKATAEKIDDDHKTGVLAAVASAEARAGRIDEALKIAETLRVEPLDRATALQAIALAEGKAGQREAALRTLKEALELQVHTLAQEASRQQARVSGAILQAQLGDIDGALRAAASLGNAIEGGYSDRSNALQGIALEQAKKKDLEGALRTIGGIRDEGRRVAALVALGSDRAEAEDRIGARLCLTRARELFRTLPPGESRNSAEAEATGLEVELQVRGGDSKEALKTVRAIPSAYARGQMILDIARLQAKRGGNQAVIGTLKQAVEAADSMRDDKKDPMGVQTLAPQWMIFKGHLARQVAKALTQFGAVEDAQDWANRETDPYVRALLLLGIAEGK